MHRRPTKSGQRSARHRHWQIRRRPGSEAGADVDQAGQNGYPPMGSDPARCALCPLPTCHVWCRRASHVCELIAAIRGGCREAVRRG
jgi:hypothetical protein